MIDLKHVLMEVDRLGHTFVLAGEIDALSPITLRVLLTRVKPRTRGLGAAQAFLAEEGVPVLETNLRAGGLPARLRHDSD